MFFGSNKRHGRRPDASRTSDPLCNDPVDHGNETVERHLRLWQTWRLSAQKVSRTWNEWLAADDRREAASYSRYLCALAEEERAASEMEVLVRCDAERESAGDRSGAIAHTDAGRS